MEVHRCQASTAAQLEMLAGLAAWEEVDLWTEASLVRPTDIMTVAGSEAALLRATTAAGIPCYTVIQDVEMLVEEERRARAEQRDRAGRENFSLTEYHDYNEVRRQVFATLGMVQLTIRPWPTWTSWRRSTTGWRRR